MGGRRRRGAGARTRRRVGALAATLLAAAAPLACAAPPLKIEAVDGALDLSAWDGEAPAQVALRGAWRLYWRELLEPRDLPELALRRPSALHDPALDFDVELGGDPSSARPRDGWATYVLSVTLPPRFPSDEAADPWMISLESQGQPLRLEVLSDEGEPLAPPLVAGVVATTAQEWVASDRDVARPLVPTGGRPLVLLLQTARFPGDFRTKPGVITLGRSAAIEGEHAARRQNRLIVIGVCLVMGLYHLALFVLRRSERAPLFFALLSLTFALRQFFRFDLFEDRTPGHDAYRLHAVVEYVAFFAVVPLFIAFIRALFPRDLPRRVVTAIGGVTVLASALAALPLGLAAATLSFFELFTLFAVLVAAAAMIRVIARGRDRQVTTILGAGIAVLLLTTLNDILSNRGLIRSVPLEHVGMFAFIFAQAMVLAVLNMRARGQAEGLARGLARFVPSEFTRLLGKRDIVDVKLGDAVHGEMTVLFCDIRGFTGLSERIEVPQIFALLNTIYARLAPLIREHHGFIDKYIGDAIMALFPGPPRDALAAAIAISEAIATVRLPRDMVLTATGAAPELAIGIGVHRGPVMLGTIGERQRMEATVIADAVNVASRLEGLSKRFGAGVLLSAEVVAAIHADARGSSGSSDSSDDDGAATDAVLAEHSRDLGHVRLEGKRRSVEIVEVFAADPPPLRQAKRASRPAFAAALARFQAGDFAAAAAAFAALAKDCPNDQPAAVYAAAAAALAASPPELRFWDGALVIHGK
ncbi:MAG: adenylate/guanylate cyclase domain-containing protein [Nannocystaceae bacterium]